MWNIPHTQTCGATQEGVCNLEGGWYISYPQSKNWMAIVQPNQSCCCLLATSPGSVTKSWGGGFTTSVSDYLEPRICRLFLRRYYYPPPCTPLLLLDFTLREITPPYLSYDTSRLASERDHLPTWASPVSVPSHRYRVIYPQDTSLTWALLVSNAAAQYPATTSRFPIPSDLPSCHAFRIFVASTSVRLQESLLATN